MVVANNINIISHSYGYHYIVCSEIQTNRHARYQIIKISISWSYSINVINIPVAHISRN